MDAFFWLIGLEVVGLAAFPVASAVFRGWPDRGYAMARPLGLILLGHAVWFTSILGITGFTGPTIVVFAGLLAALGWLVLDGPRAFREADRRLVLLEEGLFLAAFAGATLLRSFSPAIAGQEKPMDLTFLHSLIRAASLPAEDSWLAGYGLPYYYFGYLTHSLLAKVSGVLPAIAYNLAVASVLALGASAAFGLAANLLRRTGASPRAANAWGVGGASALTCLGNLEAFIEVVASRGLGDPGFWMGVGLKQAPAVGTGATWFPTDGSWWFRAARVIPNIQPDGITEFPYFSFLLGDLHPHYMALPVAVLIVALALNRLLGPSAISEPGPTGPEPAGASPFQRERQGVDPPVSRPIQIWTHSVVLGSVIPTNTWDVPIFWGAFALGSLGGAVLRHRFTWSTVRIEGITIGLVVLLAILCYFPYFVGYTSQALGVGTVNERTPLGSLLILFGLLLVLPVLAAPIALAAQGGRPLGGRARVAGLGAMATGALLVVLREPTLGLLVGTLAAWMLVLWRRTGGQGPRLASPPEADRPATGSSTDPVHLVGPGLVTLGLGALLVPEVIFLRDLFDSRMNSVFKFYYDAWILLALAIPFLGHELVLTARRAADAQGRVAEGSLNLGSPSAAARSVGAPRLRATGPARPARWFARGALGAGAFLALAGALYPLGATPARTGGFSEPPSLDGMSHLRRARPDDAQLIDWLREHHSGARVAEAVGDDYTDAARIATFAGTVAPIGWVGHELQWRGQVPALTERRELVRSVYTEPDDERWRVALGRLSIDFVTVGTLEREIYGPRVDSRFEGLLEPVRRTGASVIYRVTGTGS